MQRQPLRQRSKGEERMSQELFQIFPELFLLVAGLALLIFGVTKSQGQSRLVTMMAVVVLLIALALQGNLGHDRSVVVFDGLYNLDGFSSFLKILILFASALSLLMSISYMEREEINRFEYPVLGIFATVGMMVMVSAQNLMTLYIGLELQSLALYVMASINRDNLKSSEAGLKYFILGALSSGMLLYGISLIYGFTGSTDFAVIAQAVSTMETGQIGVLIGLVFVLAALAFKISAVPFHMWTPDVYEGAPTPVTAFFAAAPKIAALGLLCRVTMGVFGSEDWAPQWQQIVIVLSVASMLLGAFAGVVQKNIKRLLAYSSIGHVGYALLGLAAGTQDGVSYMLVYLALYMFMTLGAFAIILAMRQNGRMLENIADLAGFSRNHPVLSLALAIIMFSMAGIPPLAGFFGKFYVFTALLESAADGATILYTVAVIGMLASVISAFYYIRVVKVCYFDEPADKFDAPLDSELSSVITVSVIVVAFFIVCPSPIVEGAMQATQSLVGN